MTKRKLSPHSGSIAKRQLNRIHKRGHKFKAFFMLQFSFAAHDFLYLYTHIRFSVTSLISILKGRVGFPQMALIKLILVYFSLTF